MEVDGFADFPRAVLHEAGDGAGVGPLDVVDGQLTLQFVDDEPTGNETS